MCNVKIITKIKLFKLTKINENGYGWHTHIDIKDAFKLNLSIEIDDEIDNNCYLYDESKLVNVAELFKKPLMDLYEYKNNCTNKEQEIIIKNVMNFTIQCMAEKKTDNEH